MKKLSILLVFALLLSLFGGCTAPEAEGADTQQIVLPSSVSESPETDSTESTSETDDQPSDGTETGDRTETVDGSETVDGTENKKELYPLTYKRPETIPDSKVLPKSLDTQSARALFDVSPNGPISAENEAEIVQAFGREFPTQREACAGMWVEGIGVFGDTYVFYLNSPAWGYTDAIVEISVGGVKFVFPDSQTYYIYNNGKFYGLESAYNAGLLSTEDLLTIRNSDGMYDRYRTESSFFLVEGEQLAKDWLAATSKEVDFINGASFRYYGTRNGYHLLLHYTAEGSKTLTVGGYTFEDNNPFRLYAYKDGKFTPLETLCVEGVPDSWELPMLVAYHQGRQKADLFRYGNLSPLPEETVRVVEQAFESQRNSPCDLQHEDYFGTFDGRIVFLNVADLGVWEDLVIENVRLRAVNDFWVYDNGTILSLKEAFSRGMLSKDSIAQIRDRHAEYYTYYYRAETSPEKPSSFSADLQIGIETEWFYYRQERLLLTEYDCFGTYNGFSVFLAPNIHNPESTISLLGGKVFILPGKTTFFAFRDGKLYWVESLIRGGFLSQQDAVAIADQYIRRYGAYTIPEVPEDLPQLSEDLCKELADAWFVNGADPLKKEESLICYGEYNGCLVVARRIDRYSFYVTYSFFGASFSAYGSDSRCEIGVYRLSDKSFFWLRDFAQEGIFDEEIAKEICRVHNIFALNYAAQNGSTDLP